MTELWALCRVPRERICHFRYTLEAYEGLCIATTLPGRAGLVAVRTSEALGDELRATLAGLAEEVPFEVLRWGGGEPPTGVPGGGESGPDARATIACRECVASRDVETMQFEPS